MDKINQQNQQKGKLSPQTKEQQQAKKEKLALALRANLRRRKIPAQSKGEQE